MSEDGQQPPKPWYSRHKSLRFRATSFLSSLTKGKVRSPLYHSAYNYHANKTDDKLESKNVDSSHEVKIGCLWAVEFYTPDTINLLYESLDRLKAVKYTPDDRHPGNWLRQMRGRDGSSMELYLTQKGKRIFGYGHYCPIPTFVESATGSIICVTPSLTALVMHFYFKDEEVTRLNDELHRSYETQIIQNSDGSVSHSSPTLQRQRIVKEQRSNWLGQVSAWYRTNFPGLLTLNDELVPVCELAIINGTKPLEKSNSKLLRALGLEWSYPIFEGRISDGELGLQFCPQSYMSENDNYHILSTNASEMDDINKPGYGADLRSKVAWLDTRFRRTFAMSSLTRVIDFYSKRTATARDGAAAVVGSKKVSKALARVRSDTAHLNDASLVAQELHDASESHSIPEIDLNLMLRIEQKKRNAISLQNAIKDRIQRTSRDLLINVRLLNEILNAQANLLSAHANLKLQPIIIGLAIISMFASIIAAVEPFQKLSRWLHPPVLSNTKTITNN